ncbi:MAG: hypothetical protein RLZZ507_3759, partial [Cyanobacteriota bacterium]
MTNIIQTLSTIQGLSSILHRQITVKAIQRNISQGGPTTPNLEIALGNPSFYDIKITDPTNGILSGSFDTYCIDYEQPLTASTDYNGDGDTTDTGVRLTGLNGTLTERTSAEFTASVYSSYDADILSNNLGLGTFTTNPQNLGKVNWLINNQQNFLNRGFSAFDIQAAIWVLIDNKSISSDYISATRQSIWKAMFGGFSTTNVASIVTEADQHGNFIPQVGDKIAVVIVPDNLPYDGVPDGQIIIAAVELTRLTASLGDRVWLDTNANGIQDTGEAGIPNVTVNLLDSNNNIVATTTTDANGLYDFAGLIPGTYSVEFVAPTGYLFSPQDQGNNDGLDSDANVITSRTQTVTLAPGENNPTLDAGLYQPASLGDYVFVDNNNNGIQDAGDTAIGGVTVALIENGQVIATTTTANDGSYLFDGLTPGDYQVQFTAPEGYIFTQGNVGDDATDSDVDATGLTQTVTLQSGENNLTLDAGLVELASLGDFVWHDLNADGIQDAN